MTHLQAKALADDARNCGIKTVGVYEFNTMAGYDEATEVLGMVGDSLGSEFFVVMCNGRFSPMGYSQAIVWLESFLHGVAV